MSYLAPSGTPIGIRLLLRWLARCFNTENVLNEFAEKIKRSYGVKYCLFLSSGRTALYLLLECLYKLRNEPEKNQVIIPSYTCFSVPGSIEKAGLETRVCDIDPDTLSYDLTQLANYDFSKVLAIVTSNLYGIPNQLPEIEKIAREYGVYLVDDAAQCLGGKVGGQYSGTFGDVGLFSLDKGKNITSIQGGIIVTDNDNIANAMTEVIDELPKQSASHVLTDCIKMIIYAVLLPPGRYWIITKIPFLGLGLTPYTTDYPVHKYSPVMATIANLLFDNLDSISNKRVSNALEIKEKLKELADIKQIQFNEKTEPVFLRLPVIVEDPDKRRKLLEALHTAGIGATASYPSAIVDIKQIHHKLSRDNQYAIAGKKIAEQIITIPTNPYATSNHISRIESVCREILG